MRYTGFHPYKCSSRKFIDISLNKTSVNTENFQFESELTLPFPQTQVTNKPLISLSGIYKNLVVIRRAGDRIETRREGQGKGRLRI